MSVSVLFGRSAFTLGVALATVWVLVVGRSLYRYREGSGSRERVHLVLWSGAFWLAYGLLQMATGVSGTAERGIQALAVGLFGSGVALGVRWWRLRAE